MKHVYTTDTSALSRPRVENKWPERNQLEKGYKAAFALGEITGTEMQLLEQMRTRSVVFADGGILDTSAAEFHAGLLGKHRSIVSRTLRSLERKGWVADRTGARGYRGCRGGFWYGIDLTPGLDKIEECTHKSKEHRETMLHRSKVKDYLRGQKNALQKALARSNACVGAALEHAREVLLSLPRRFDQALEVLETWVHRVTEALKALEDQEVSDDQETNDYGEGGVASSRHGCRTIPTPSTDTNNKDSNCNTPQGSSSVRRQEREETERRTEKRVEREPAIEDVMPTLTPDERAMLEELYEAERKNGTVNALRFMLDGVQQLALRRWHLLDGPEYPLGPTFQRLGQLKGSVMLLLVADRCCNQYAPPVANKAKYLESCIHRSERGEFGWQAGLAAAKKRSATLRAFSADSVAHLA